MVVADEARASSGRETAGPIEAKGVRRSSLASRSSGRETAGPIEARA